MFEADMPARLLASCRREKCSQVIGMLNRCLERACGHKEEVWRPALYLRSAHDTGDCTLTVLYHVTSISGVQQQLTPLHRPRIFLESWLLIQATLQGLAVRMDVVLGIRAATSVMHQGWRVALTA